jgi:hypothetical protein
LASAGTKRRKESSGRKYSVSHTEPTATATSVEIAAPATPSGCPVPQPKIRNGASTMFSTTVDDWTTMPGLKLPVPLSAADIATMPNCSAMAGMNQRR